MVLVLVVGNLLKRVERHDDGRMVGLVGRSPSSQVDAIIKQCFSIHAYMRKKEKVPTSTLSNTTLKDVLYFLSVDGLSDSRLFPSSPPGTLRKLGPVVVTRLCKCAG